MAIDLHAARPTRVSYHRLGDRQGRKRIYLENRTVAYAGFEIGARYRVEANEAAGTLSILLDENGPRIVTRRERLAGMIPVIDVKGSDALDSIAAVAERARVEYGSGKIVVRIHADHLREVSRRKRVQANVASGKPLSIVSLCTGIGVLDHAVTTGMQDAGISARAALAVEVNENVIEQAAVASDRFAPDATLVLGRLQDLDLDLVPESRYRYRGSPLHGRFPFLICPAAGDASVTNLAKSIESTISKKQLIPLVRDSLGRTTERSTTTTLSETCSRGSPTFRCCRLRVRSAYPSRGPPKYDPVRSLRIVGIGLRSWRSPIR